VFVDDYDLVVAAQLVQGVDVWINTPRRPWEASGTSGMKVLVNGGLNLSELDGWWAEAYTSGAGWAVGDGREHDHSPEWDREEAEQLFQVLENEVVPAFYRRDPGGLPREWIGRMRESMSTLTVQYSSNRMLREYAERYYVPMAAAFRRRDAAVAAELQEWQRQLTLHWQHIHFGDIMTARTESGYHFEVPVYLDDLPADAVSVELYADPAAGGEPFRQPLERGMLLAGTTNSYVYQGALPGDRPVSDYTPRIIPAHAEAVVPLEADFILWYR
jgi:starch phosphorylase